MHTHFSFSFLAEQTDPLSGRGDSMLSVSHRHGNNNKKDSIDYEPANEDIFQPAIVDISEPVSRSTAAAALL